jgi:hypothetical protein
MTTGDQLGKSMWWSIFVVMLFPVGEEVFRQGMTMNVFKCGVFSVWLTTNWREAFRFLIAQGACNCGRATVHMEGSIGSTVAHNESSNPV